MPPTYLDAEDHLGRPIVVGGAGDDAGGVHSGHAPILRGRRGARDDGDQEEDSGGRENDEGDGETGH